jgi:hypothetical protein
VSVESARSDIVWKALQIKVDLQCRGDAMPWFVLKTAPGSLFFRAGTTSGLSAVQVGLRWHDVPDSTECHSL